MKESADQGKAKQEQNRSPQGEEAARLKGKLPLPR